MAKQNPILYSVSKTFIWFAIVSIILTGCLAAIVLMDHGREWKTWQKKFVALKASKAKEDLAKAEKKVDAKKLADLTRQHEEAEKSFKANHAEYAKAQRSLEAVESQLIRVRGRYQDQKQYADSYRYYFEEYTEHKDARAASYEKKLKAIEPGVLKLKLQVESLEADRDKKQAIVDSFLSKEKSLKKDMDKLLEEKTRLTKRLASLQPSIVNEVLNAPMVDFLAPTLEVQQVVLEDLYDNYHFAKVQKVDRCMTCHLGIDQKGFEKAPQPFRTHPNLDRYLGADSPHPIEKFGCTVCHGGNGHSVSFRDTAHTPKDDTQKKEWEKKYQWKELEKWEAKMLPSNYIEAACAKCHTNAADVPMAPKLNQGRKLAESKGCFNCHKVDGYEDSWKVGPDLRNIKGKVDSDWVNRWLQDPTAFRPSTSMPKIFHLSNTNTPEDREKNNAAIEAITYYLMKNSSPVALSKPPVQGDSTKGETLVKELGCLGCHSVAGVQGGVRGPELSGLGSKVSDEWLYTWLKNPKSVSHGTAMPNLRLSDQEASDITAYLLSLKNESFDKTQATPSKPEVINAMVLESLQSNLRREEAETALSKMSAEERLEYLGKKSISHQGCYTCHSITGFEDAKRIGTDLSHEGSKNLHQFDFGYTKIDRTRHAWIVQKLKDPRVYDHGKVKGYYEKLRMPQFKLSDEEIEALTTFILSRTEEEVPLEMHRQMDLNDVRIEKGRLLISKLNCNGCHTLDGRTGTLWEITDDKGAAPPMLDGEGAKVQEKWLHEFLKSPQTIRPWLKVRMPTFDLTDEEASTLVEYFTHLSGQEVSYKGHEVPATTPEKLAAGKDLFDKFQCAKCHQVTSESAAMGTSFLAPDLALAKSRLKPEWVKKWILDPQALQEGTMMPGFFPDGQSPLPDVLGGDAGEQVEAIRDYLYTYTGQEPPKDKKKA